MEPRPIDSYIKVRFPKLWAGRREKDEIKLEKQTEDINHIDF